MAYRIVHEFENIISFLQVLIRHVEPKCCLKIPAMKEGVVKCLVLIISERAGPNCQYEVPIRVETCPLSRSNVTKEPLSVKDSERRTSKPLSLCPLSAHIPS